MEKMNVTFDWNMCGFGEVEHNLRSVFRLCIRFVLDDRHGCD
jgi:hypothetical protein